MAVEELKNYKFTCDHCYREEMALSSDKLPPKNWYYSHFWENGEEFTGHYCEKCGLKQYYPGCNYISKMED